MIILSAFVHKTYQYNQEKQQDWRKKFSIRPSKLISGDGNKTEGDLRGLNKSPPFNII